MNETEKSTSNLTHIEVLLQIEDDGTVRAKKLYTFLELHPAHYAKWCKNNIEENEFAEENVDYKVFTPECENPKGGRPSVDYKLTVYFAKKLCMLPKNERGEMARDYFARVEELHKDTKLALNSLSPQLQLLINMELKQNEMEKQLAVTTKKINIVEDTLETVKDTIVRCDDNWRADLNKMFNKAVEASGTNDYQALRKRTYDILEERARCDINTRLRNLHERMSAQGATKAAIKAITKLDVIERDVRLKEIYTGIIKEFSISYDLEQGQEKLKCY